MGRVLAAERAAYDAIAQAERDAAETIDQAREKAQQIDARAEGRTRRAGDAYESATAAALAAIATGDGDDIAPTTPAADDRLLQAAVTALAAKLSGDVV